MRNHPSPRYFWLGGSPCAGKSSIAWSLVSRFSLELYECDKSFETHVKRAAPDTAPVLDQIGRLSWDEIWMAPVEVLLEREITAYREEFPMILTDLADMAETTTRPILVEGAALLPDCVVEQLSEPRQGCWVVPTEAFQREYYPKRDWIQTILQQCREPEQAFRNWMDRDVAFARYVAERAEALGLTMLWVDGRRSIAENAEFVVRHFGLVEAK